MIAVVRRARLLVTLSAMAFAKRALEAALNTEDWGPSNPENQGGVERILGDVLSELTRGIDILSTRCAELAFSESYDPEAVA